MFNGSDDNEKKVRYFFLFYKKISEKYYRKKLYNS